MKINTITNNFTESKYLDNSILNVDCGEISMLADAGVFEKDGVIYEHLGDICNLGSLNLCEYVNIEMFANRTTPLPDWKDGLKDEFDWDEFTHDTELLVRGLDNLIDISGYPLEALATAAKLRRKIGAGIFGYGSALMLMGMKYGSPESLAFTERLMSVFVNVAYQTSAELAKEKGSFLLFDKNQIFKNGFIANSGLLWDDTIKMIHNYGLRNSQLLAIAPTGNLSIYAGCISGGIEPAFELDYYRWAIMNHREKQVLAGKVYPKYDKGEWFETNDFKFEMRGDDQVLISTCGEFMIDKNRGLTQKINVKEYAYNVITEKYSADVIKDYRKRGVFSTAMELTAIEHVDPFILLGKYVDNSISKCMRIDNTMVIIDDKIKYLDELKFGNEDTFVECNGQTLNHKKELVNVAETYNNGKQDVIRVSFDDSSFIDCTLTHKIYIDGHGWKKAIDLTIGEKIS